MPNSLFRDAVTVGSLIGLVVVVPGSLGATFVGFDNQSAILLIRILRPRAKSLEAAFAFYASRSAAGWKNKNQEKRGEIRRALEKKESKTVSQFSLTEMAQF